MQAQRLVNTKDLSHDEWLKYRQMGLGGSDIAAIMGYSKFKSPIAVYLDKIGELPPLEDNPRMKAGRIMEPVIAEWFAEDTGLKVWRQNAVFQDPIHKFMLANIDRWLPGKNAGLEIKNTSEFCRHEWEGSQAPTEYVLQCNHYMAVTGADRWYIAVCIGGWDFQWRIIERNEELIQNLIVIERTFWEDHVLVKSPPAYSHQDTELLKERFPESSAGKAMNLPEEAYDDIQGLYAARAAKAAATQAEDTHKNRLKGYMEDAELAYFQDELKFTWKKNAKSRPFKVIGGEE